ncbi:DUF1599 domain-containing protein [Chitinophagales bacterium]|nr:DUF1599 domain-containing protein [Chitinophagales bacterium]
MNKTETEYQEIRESCASLFRSKTTDYGTAWRILRSSSLTDQIYIKAARIRSLQVKGVSKVGEGIEDEFVGIVNYCIMALIQLELGYSDRADMEADDAITRYEKQFDQSFELMKRKNHDYGEAWRSMRVSSITDLILMKLLRVKQIEDNDGSTLVSEGLDANYQDMINYAIFALIKLRFSDENT